MQTDILFQALLVAAGIAALFGGILYLVAAFREGIGWGLLTFLPLGTLIFTCMKWQAAKKAFVVSLVATALFGGAIVVAMTRTQSEFPLAFGSLMETKVEKETAKPADILEKLRIDEATASEQVRASTAELKVQYLDLRARRASLPADDEAAVIAFNSDAALYAERNAQLAAAIEKRDALLRAIAVEENTATPASPEVTIYSTSWCGPCKMAKAHLAQRGVAFREIDVEKDPAGAAEFQKLGGGGVPLIVIGGESLRGFNAQAIDSLLDRG